MSAIAMLMIEMSLNMISSALQLNTTILASTTTAADVG